MTKFWILFSDYLKYIALVFVYLIGFSNFAQLMFCIVFNL